MIYTIIVLIVIAGVFILFKRKTESKIKIPARSVKFKYEIPIKLLDYVMLDVCYNENKDAKFNPVTSATGEVECSTDVLPSTIPLVFQCSKTNRPAIDNLFRIRMEIYVDNVVTNTHFIDITIHDLLSNPLKRTYAVKFDRNGEITYQLPR